MAILLASGCAGLPADDGGGAIGGMAREEARSWWAFQPLPVVEGAPRPGVIDSLLEAQWAERSLEATRAADRRTWLRRATYGLLGLPPTPEEVEAFLADDSAEAESRVIERLLASPQYGIHWGRHWLDVVRYADTAGENTDRPLPHAWRYRNWVMDAFNRDLPYDEFVRLQLAGDRVAAGGDAEEFREGIIATGYLAVARRFGHDIDKDIHLTHEDVIDNLGKNFLGLTLGCARCHEHKYDPVTMEDYYALYGIFDSSRFSFPGCEPKGQPRDLVPIVTDAGREAIMRPYEEARARAEAARARLGALRDTIKTRAGGSFTVLAEGAVAEGGALTLEAAHKEDLQSVAVLKGEVIQLAVLPNGGHGADSTRVEWTIREVGGGGNWSVEDLVDVLLEGNPLSGPHGAQWCFLDVTDGPTFLPEKQAALDGRGELRKWGQGDTPSAFVNAAEEEVPVWTKLPPRSFFVHPGVERTVAVAWVSPIDGTVAVSGRVTDAHPAPGLDGVSFRLEHFTDPEVGMLLVDLGKRSQESRPAELAPPDIPVAYAVVDGEAHDAVVHLRGDPETPGPNAPRRWLEILGGDPLQDPAQSGRGELAEWVIRSPLAARVMVNRVWTWHFGEGLVRTPNDFGPRGERPSHPELLDWLAAHFVAGGYSVKDLHRLIMRTEAYRRGSTASPEAISSDPENHWLARFSRRRLTAEEIRDSLLSVSGRLDPTFGEAHPFPPEATWRFTQHDPFVAVYPSDRRSAFLMVQRQRRHPFLALFDGADPNASTAKREASTVPTQALYFLNDPFFHEQAAALAASLPDSQDEKRLEALFVRVFQRSPTGSESHRARAFLVSYPASRDEAWAAYTRVLLASNEFLHLD